MARPRKLVPTNAAAVIEQAAARGANQRGIASAVGVALITLQKWFTEVPALREAYERGRERERDALHHILAREADKGNIVAAMFLLKARHGYREGDQAEQGNHMHVTFTLPGAMSMEQFRTIDGTATHDEPIPAPRVTRSRGR
ncbi:MAG: hypothetical protein WA190_03205 [Usitatibacter sp.]